MSPDTLVAAGSTPWCIIDAPSYVAHIERLWTVVVEIHGDIDYVVGRLGSWRGARGHVAAIYRVDPDGWRWVDTRTIGPDGIGDTTVPGWCGRDAVWDMAISAGAVSP